jgi:hypothetical protein
LTDGSKFGAAHRTRCNAGAGPDDQRAGRSVVATAVVHADDMVDDRAKVSDHIGDDGCLFKAGTMIQTPC